MKKLTTLISVVAMMCAVIAALAFSIWAAVYGDSHYRFYKKEYQKYENDGLVSGRATITATNLDLVDNFKALNDMKFRSIPMAPAQNLLSDEDYDRLIGENTKLVQYFLELIQSGDYKTAKKTSDFDVRSSEDTQKWCRKKNFMRSGQCTTCS